MLLLPVEAAGGVNRTCTRNRKSDVGREDGRDWRGAAETGWEVGVDR